MNKYIELTRPLTAIFPFLCCFFVGLVGIILFNSITLDKLIFASISLALTQIFGQITNQISDPPELDKINNKIRPIVRGEVSKSESWILSVIIFITSIILSSYVSFEYLVSIILLYVSIYMYNFEPIRLKKRFILNNLILAISRGFLPFLSIFYLMYGEINNIILILSIGISIWVFIWQTTKDIPDIVGDKKFGIKTIPVVLGIEKTYIFMTIGSLLFILYSIKISYLFLLFIPLIIYGIKNLEKEYKENTIGWLVFYIGILLYYIISILVLLKFF